MIAFLLLAQSAPLSPEEAPRHMILPEGFKVTLFAGEPDVVQPIAFAFDDRGRLWVAEGVTYPDWTAPGKEGRDRILIFEDPDGRGRFKTRKVFAERIPNISGLEIGFGGVWVTSSPYLLFIPAKGDAPSGPPEIVLDGWNIKRAQHNVLNHPTWGPDGWLWGLNGIQSDSNVGIPGTPEEKRARINCGVWRLHPRTRAFEVVATGTTNPWGIDWDEFGEAFITNCVIKHLWHVVPGAHFQRMHGQDFNPYYFALMESCADHLHFAGKDWTKFRADMGVHGQAGGGHAHVGAMVYLGDNWPDRYRGTLFTMNLHGNRMNNDILRPSGSGYVATHGPDFLLAGDPWFRGIDVRCGPDGGVFVSDWTDTGECHNFKAVDRSNGRVYKIVYGPTKAFSTDVALLPDSELVGLQRHKNDWFARHARRVLQERAAAGCLESGTAPALWKMLGEETQIPLKLRALWALHAVGALRETDLLKLLDHSDEHLRGWAVRLSMDAGSPPLANFEALARGDPSPLVRREVASTLQKLATADRWPIIEALVGHEEDAKDQNIPLLTWYGLEPLVGLDKTRAAALLVKVRIPRIREFISMRLAK